MLLRTTAGRYAGEIREYSHAAGTAALISGTAEPLDAEPACPAPALARPAPPRTGKVTQMPKARKTA